MRGVKRTCFHEDTLAFRKCTALVHMNVYCINRLAAKMCALHAVYLILTDHLTFPIPLIAITLQGGSSDLGEVSGSLHSSSTFDLLDTTSSSGMLSGSNVCVWPTRGMEFWGSQSYT